MSCATGDYVCIVENCSGAVGSGQVLFDYWDSHNCPAAYSQFINTAPDGTLSYDVTSQQNAELLVSNLFDVYSTTNTITDDVTSPEYNPFQNTLLSLCLNPTLPGICADYLTSYCAEFTRDEAINSPTLTNFCGCYVPPNAVYLQYTLGTSGCLIGDPSCQGCSTGTTGCTGQPACDPLCHRAMTSQRAYQPTGNFITCPQSVCVIDDVTINIENSNVPGGINFNNICSGCGGASGGDGCLCVVSGTNVSSTMAGVGVGTNFNQFCGNDSVCIVEDDNGNITSVSACTGINPANIGVSGGSAIPNLGLLFIFIFLVLLILFLCVMARVTMYPPKQKSTTPELIYSQSTPKTENLASAQGTSEPLPGV